MWVRCALEKVAEAIYKCRVLSSKLSPLVKGTVALPFMNRDLCNMFYQVEWQSSAVPGIGSLDPISRWGTLFWETESLPMKQLVQHFYKYLFYRTQVLGDVKFMWCPIREFCGHVSLGNKVKSVSFLQHFSEPWMCAVRCESQEHHWVSSISRTYMTRIPYFADHVIELACHRVYTSVRLI